MRREEGLRDGQPRLTDEAEHNEEQPDKHQEPGYAHEHSRLEHVLAQHVLL